MSFNPQEHLRRQIRFLEHSCSSYDAGFFDEAIRIATVLRVLFHQTQRSTSLMTHLNAQDIHIISTAPIQEPGSEPVFVHSMAALQMSGT